MKKLVSLAFAAMALFGHSANAQQFQPAVIFDMGGKFDKSFNEGVYNGAERFRKETNITYRDFEITNDSQREQALRNMATRGATIITIAGFSAANAVEKVAKEFPNVKFTIIDAVVDLPNVQSVVFKEHEGSFLVGAIAAKTSKTGVIGFIGGMDIPLIRNFACGYKQGARAVNPKITVLQNMTGTTGAAWNDPTRGAELARSQFDRKADVVFAAAGATGLGVMQAAKDSKKLAIGVDSNQNYLHPGTILTSMLKRVDVAVYDALQAARNNTWKPGIRIIGLSEGGVDWALDQYNRSLITPEVEKMVGQYRQDIISGKIKVADYYTNNKCPIE